jgi:hypothetical protein
MHTMSVLNAAVAAERRRELHDDACWARRANRAARARREARDRARG